MSNMELYDAVTKKIFDGIEKGLIDSKYIANIDYVPRLLVNNPDDGEKVLTDIIKELKSCDEFFFCVAFLTMGGYQQLFNTFNELKENNIKGKIIVSQYQNFTDPQALKNIIDKFPNIDLRIVTEDIVKMHLKGYIFKANQDIKIIVGSSNLTADALSVNKEWNVKLTSTNDGSYAIKVIDEFKSLLAQSIKVDDNFINEYEIIYNQKKRQQQNIEIVPMTIRPNKMQEEALENLKLLREANQTRALCISSTGTGKTILSALDVKAFKPKKFLFVVHREQIAKDALKTYKRVIGNDINACILGGGHKEDADYIFAMVQTLSKDNILNYFKPTEFDYIVFDEVHHLGASGTLKVFNYFKPKFVLGMTATPERTDGYDIYQLFNYNIACNIRLQDAMKEDLICPFHYYAISDFMADGQMVDDKTEFNKLVSKDRVEHVINQAQYYGFCGSKVKGLVFVSRVEEAKVLSQEFNKYGFKTMALSGENSQQEREKAIQLLESDDKENYLDYIFTRDIFNEGIDIRCINQIIMLRPTESAIIFVQQLGRGLRKYIDKEYLVVLDFIGNYDNNFLIPIALSGDRSYNKDNIRRFISEGNNTIPGESTINFERVVEQNIFDKIDKVRLNTTKILKDSYLELKYKIGRIPNYFDYEKYGSIEVFKFFDKFDSYHEFLTKYEADYHIKYNYLEELYLKLLSQKYIKCKRPFELELLLQLIDNNEVDLMLFRKNMSNKYSHITFNQNAIDNLINQFTGNYLVGTEAPQYNKVKFASSNGNKLTIDPTFKNMLQSENFRKEIDEIIDFGLHTYSKNFDNNYEDLAFSLYQKYSYDDVCKLLDWDKNAVATNIGGYKYDAKTNTLPIFVNYHKDDDIADSIKYNDYFISRNVLSWISKNKRYLSSPDVKNITAAKINKTKILLFVRKNKKDEENFKEFYFLGEISPISEPKEITMASGDHAVNFEFLLETPVREDIFDYIVNK